MTTGTTIILDDPHLTVRLFVSLLDISIGSVHVLLLIILRLPHVCLVNSMFTLTVAKKKKKFMLKCTNI